MPASHVDRERIMPSVVMIVERRSRTMRIVMPAIVTVI
jgi:hypothetical protein